MTASESSGLILTFKPQIDRLNSTHGQTISTVFFFYVNGYLCNNLKPKSILGWKYGCLIHSLHEERHAKNELNNHRLWTHCGALEAPLQPI